MKKEDLGKIGLTEEQQTEVFKLNGLAIEQYKIENANLTNTIQTLETEKTYQQQIWKQHNNFLQTGNLKGRSDYFGVSGYNRSISSKIYWADKKVKNIANSVYNLGSTKADVNGCLRDKPISDYYKIIFIIKI